MNFDKTVETLSPSNLWGVLTAYWANANMLGIKFWIVPLCTLAFLFTALFIVTKILNRERSSQGNLDEAGGARKINLSNLFGIRHAWIIAASLTALGLVIWIAILGQKGAAFRSDHDLSTIISLTFVAFCPLVSLWKLRGSFTRHRLKNLAPQAHTPVEEHRTVLRLNKAFKFTKLWMLIPFLGLLILFTPGLAKRSIVAIMLDNSGSMSDSISRARTVLEEILPEFPKGSLFVITTFSTAGEKESMEEIMAVNAASIGELSGEIFETEDPGDAIAYIDGIATDQASPVCEGIWKTFLHVEGADPSSYPNRLLLVVTDGGESANLNLGEPETQFFGSNEDFLAVFPKSSVHFIDVRAEDATSGEDFFDASKLAEFRYEDARNPLVYDATFGRLLSPWTVDPDIVILTVLILLIALVMAPLITPKRVRPLE